MSTTSFPNFLTVIILLLTIYDKTIIIIVCLKIVSAVHTLEILVSGQLLIWVFWFLLESFGCKSATI